MANKKDNRIDSCEASRAMANKTSCSFFPCFSSTDLDQNDRHPSGDDPYGIYDYISRNSQSYEGDLDSFIERISQRLEQMEKKNTSFQNRSRHNWPWPRDSKSLQKLRELLSAGMKHASKLTRGNRARLLECIMKTIEDKDLATSGLLAVAYVLETFPRDFTNKTECSSLLVKMDILARRVKDFEEGHQLMDGKVKIKDATELIMEGYIMCCVELKPSSFFKFFSSSTKKEKLHKFEEKFEMFPDIKEPGDINILDANDSKCVDVYLDGLKEHISQLLNGKTNRNLEESPRRQLPPGSFWRFCRCLSSSEALKRLNEFLSAGIECASELKKCMINEEFRTLLDGVARASTATSVLLMVVYVLEKVEDMSENNEECWLLLKEIFFLAKLLKQLEENHKGMLDLINEGKELIERSAETCLTQIEDDGFSKFFSTSVNKSELGKIRKNLDNEYKKINAKMGVRVLEVIECQGKPRLSRGYPEHAVGIHDSLKIVTDLLEWGSQNKVGAVILYGFGGTGKTTLADAVFSRVKFDGCQYSMVQLFENTASTRRIVEVQRMILQDLMGSKNIPDIRKHEDGQRELGRLLENVPALIYIDNVLDEHTLRQLLPVNLDKAKKLRMLITARNKNVGRACPMTSISIKEYPMTSISSTAAMSLLKREMFSDGKRTLNSRQVDHIIEICGGVPLMLKLAASALRFEEDEHKVCKVIEELEKMEGETFGNNIEPYFFAYDNLPEACKDPFLDICSFFEGCGWDRVADIVGKSELHMLQHRGLVIKGTNGVEPVAIVPSVILKIARKKTERMELRFITASQLMEFLHKKDERVEQLRYLTYKPSKDLNELIEMPSKLKYIEIDGKLQPDDLKIFPSRLLHLPDLRILKLINFEGLEKLPWKLATVKGLRELTLSNCKSLELPHSLPKLESLRVLTIDGCETLKDLPEDFPNLTSLVELNLSNCQKLSLLPKNFGLLNSLRTLNLNNCESLEELPKEFEKLLSLRVLNLSYCKALKNLPSDLGNLKSLVHLYISHCSKLENLPSGLKKLTSLVQLDILHCSKLVSISEGIGDLKSLPSMDISGCSNLTELPNGFCNLSITYLNLTKCDQLKNLPKDFGKLKSLRALKLMSCRQLQELPESFSELKNLLHLDLSGCGELKKLCTHFRDLTSLQHLDLSDCLTLEESSINSIRQIKTLEKVFNTNTGRLANKQGEIQGQPSNLQLYPGKDSSKEDKETLSKLDDLLKDGRGNPFDISDRRLDTIVVVIFDARQNFNHTDFPWLLMEDTIDDLRNLEMIYIGKHFNRLPPRVAHKIMRHARDSLDARLLFDKVFSTLESDGESDRVKLWQRKTDSYFSMTATIVEGGNGASSMTAKIVEGGNGAKIVEDGNGARYLSWKLLSNYQMEEHFFTNCGRYLRLKELATKAQKSNIQLLWELYANGRDENCLLRGSRKVGVDELQGKVILIDVRPANACYDTRLHSLCEMYKTRKKELNLEIISIPVGQQSNRFEQFSRGVPWLIPQNPLTSRAVNYFLIKECQWEEGKSSRSESWYPSRIMKIESNGKIAPYQPVLSMLERWGPKEYPFSDVEELRNREWNELKDMSSLEFLFKPLKDDAVVKLMKEGMKQGKSICLLCDGRDPDTHRVRIKTFVGSIKRALKEVMDRIHIIYVTFYDDDKKKEKLSTYTDSISMAYYPLGEPKMPQDEKGLSLLKLSEWAAMRFWMRARDLQEEIKDRQIIQMKRLLDSLKFGELSMGIIDKDGEMVTHLGRQIVDVLGSSNKDIKAKEWTKGVNKDETRKLLGHMIKGSKTQKEKASSSIKLLLAS